MGKNWIGINALQNPNLRLAFAQISTDSTLGKRLTIAFPECFTAGPDEGPVPLSVIVRKGWELTGGNYYDDEKALDQLQIPFARWSLTEFDFEPDKMSGFLSEEYKAEHEIVFGATIPLEGQNYVVVYQGEEEITLAPVERVLPDIDHDGRPTASA